MGYSGKKCKEVNLGDLQSAIDELALKSPNWEKIQALAQKNGFPFKKNSIEQIDLILSFLDQQKYERRKEVEA